MRRLLLGLTLLCLLAGASTAEAAPTASFTISPNPAIAGQVTTFDAAASTCDRAPCSYRWFQPEEIDAADGTADRVATFTYNHVDVGTEQHMIRLRVRNANGEISSLTKYFKVVAATTPPPPPPPPPPADADGDGVPDASDQCPGTPAGTPVDANGCPVATPPPDGLNCAPAASQTMTNTVSHLCGYPDTTNTGVPAGTTLQRVPQDATSGPGWHWDSRGWVSVDTPGAVFANKLVAANVDVTADNVTVENVRIQYGSGDGWGGWGVSLRHARNVTIRNSTIAGNEKLGPGRLDNAIRDIYGDSEGVRIVGNEIFWSSSAVNHVVAGGVIEGNYFHDFGFNTATGLDHTNGIQTEGSTGTQLTIRNNTILVDRNQTDAIMLSGWESQQRNRLVENNLLAGGGYTLYGAGSATERPVNIVVRNNHFSRVFYPNSGYWGPVAYWYAAGAGNVWSGNVWDNTGATLSP